VVAAPGLVRTVFLAWVILAAALLGLGGLVEANRPEKPAENGRLVRAQAQ
jgi:hypothetical protein